MKTSTTTTQGKEFIQFPVNNIKISDTTAQLIALLHQAEMLGDRTYRLMNQQFAERLAIGCYENDFEPHILAIIKMLRTYVSMSIYESISNSENVTNDCATI